MKDKLNRAGIFLIVSIILLSLLAACTSSSKEAKPSQIEVTDQSGRIVKLDKIPERIISLAPSNTEILFALGLTDKLIAVTDYCDYPPEAKDKPSVGGYTSPNIEKIVEIQPDLILATSVHEQRIIPQLEDKGLTVFVLKPHTMDEVLEAITLVGEITGNEREATGLVADMQDRIKSVTGITDNLAQEQRPRVSYVIWHDPLMASGTGTLQHDLLKKAGGNNIAQDLTGYAAISLERVLEANPEVMIAGGGHGSGKNQHIQYIETEPRLRDTAARLNGRVYMINGDLTSRPGPRIVEGLEKFAEFIHPELFKKAR